MKKLHVLFLLTLCACGRPSGSLSEQKIASEDTATSRLISCWGIGDIELEDTFELVEQKVGKKHMRLDSVYLEGEFEQIISVVWQGSDKEIRVFWKEKQPPFNSIRILEINRSKSVYAFANGIRIGTDLKTIEKLNGAPVRLYGFGWDYGGAFLNFGKGKLAADFPCFGGVFQLEAASADEQLQAVMGDHEITSANPAFDKLKAKLEVIRVTRN